MNIGKLRYVLMPAVLTCLGLTVNPVMADVTIPANSSSTVNAGSSMNLVCGDLFVEGTLNLMDNSALNNVHNITIGSNGVINVPDGASPVINISGSWSNSNGGAGFVAGESQVIWNPDCEDHAPGVNNNPIMISGDTIFFDLSITTDSGRQVVFEAGSTTTILGHPILMGTGDENSSTLLRIVSSIEGVPAFSVIFEKPTPDIRSVYVQDNHAIEQWIDRGPPETYDSVDGGGNSRWFNANLTPIPTLSWQGLMIMTLLMFGLGFAGFRRIR